MIRVIGATGKLISTNRPESNRGELVNQASVKIGSYTRSHAGNWWGSRCRGFQLFNIQQLTTHTANLDGWMALYAVNPLENIENWS